MIAEGFASVRGKKILLLQGPIGPFFCRLSRALKHHGADVFKINFNGGDVVFFPTNATRYTGSLSDWPVFFRQYVIDHQIETVFLFGDCRKIHQPIRDIASSMNIELGVFEEGYLRPDYITFERNGVNGHSSLPKDVMSYLNYKKTSITKHIQVGNTYWHMAFWAVSYYIAASLLWLSFRQYEHHRPLNLLEGIPWIKSIWHKQYRRFKERGIQTMLTKQYCKRYFLVPLQVHNDSQIMTHSKYISVAHFIGDVVASFAQNAPENTILVLKQHPMDRGYSDYSAFISQLMRDHNLDGRIIYIHDQHLPTILKSALGVVVINSTVGLSAVQKGIATITCGEAIYNLPQMTYQNGLDQFWQDAKDARPNAHLVKHFTDYLIDHTQFNGSFYRNTALFKETKLLDILQNSATDGGVNDQCISKSI